jgi:hypothetical protein
MLDSDKVDFLRVLNGMAAMKKTTLIPETIDMWWICMSPWSIEDFRAAAIHVLKTDTFGMPGPNDFEKLRKAGRETAVESWARAVAHASSSRYRRGPLGIPRIDMLVSALGGYPAIAQCDESKLHFLERRFTEHFENVQDADDTREAVPQIAFDHTPELKLVSGNFKRIGGRA